MLIDMWATWCKNCLAMDRTTLERSAVTSALAGYVKVKFEADPPENPNVARVMQRLTRIEELPACDHPETEI